jgi:hypothetical protein
LHDGKKETNMRRKRTSPGIGKFSLPMVIVLVLCFAAQGISQGPAQKKAEQKPEPLSSFGIEEPRDAETFFREAQKLAPKDPTGAIRLYQRGIL